MSDDDFTSDTNFHPSDEYSRLAAHTNSADALTENFELALAGADPYFRAGGLEVVASVAIARVRLLERQLAAQEQAVRARLFGKTGRVENVVPISRPKGEKR